MSITDQLKIIEQNHIGHFEFLPKKLGFELSEINGVKLINCALQTSMFNIAYGSPKFLKTPDVINEIKQVFAGQSFAWWIPPSQHNPEVTKMLLKNGFIIEALEHAMICNLNNVASFEQKTALMISQVKNSKMLADFISVLEPYDPHVSAFYGRMNDELLNADEKLFVGYVNGKPVTIGILFVNLHNAAIFSLITKEEEQGQGYGSDMMIFLMDIAKYHGYDAVTLSASSESGYSIYERLGFVKAGEFECFEYKGKYYGENNC